MLVSDVHTANPRATKDTADLRDVYFFSRFSIRMVWDTCVMEDPVAGKPGCYPASATLSTSVVVLVLRVSPLE